MRYELDRSKWQHLAAGTFDDLFENGSYDCFCFFEHTRQIIPGILEQECHGCVRFFNLKTWGKDGYKCLNT